MRLKSLEIKGFKSFADRTILNFNEQVIGVVGPNGSGKSNVVDAIRWVLGEQKGKELRLAKMSDVIFNGTKKRKSSGVAQVSLTFSNDKNLLPTEYNNVTISRLLYASGESEYRLNDVTCRKKDITSLFIDTGIGSNSYAIIALGMVDDILQDKENARQRMFEQAAGISKFKVRKRETLNKLKATTADLDRIEDLLFEIASNLKTLEKQARKAQRYLDLKTEYKELSISAALRNSEKYIEEYKSIKAKISEDQDKYRQLNTDHNSLEAALEAEKKTLLVEEQKLSTFQKEQNSLLESIRSLESKKALALQNINYGQSAIKQIEESKETEASLIEKKKAQIKELKSSVAEQKSQEVILSNSLAESKLSFAQGSEEYQLLRKDADKANQELLTLNDQIFSIEKEIAVVLNIINESNQQIENSKTRLAQIEQEAEELVNKKSIRKREVEEQENQLATLRKLQENRLSQKAKLQEESQKWQKEVQQLNRERDSVQNEFSLLKSMIDSHEGYPDSIKFLEQKWDSEAILFTDIIQVDDTIRAAVELYLEPYLNYYVVQTRTEAVAAIKLLRDAQKGKASFFILEDIKAVALNDQILEQDGSIIPCLDYIQLKDEYKDLLHLIFKEVYVYRGEETDPQFDEVYKDKTIIDYRGFFIRKSSSLSGGSVGLFEGKKLGRKGNLDRLEKSINTIDVKIEKKQAQLVKIEKELSILSVDNEANSIREAEKVFRELESGLLILNTNADNQKVQIDQIKQSITATEELVVQRKASIKNLESERKELVNQRKLRTANTNGGAHLDQLATNLSSLKEKTHQAQLEYIQHQNKLDYFNRELEFAEKQLKESQSRLQEFSSRSTLESNSLDKNVASVKEIEETLKTQYEDKKSHSSNFADVEDAFQNSRKGILKMESDLRAITKDINAAQLSINNLKDKFSDVKLSLSGISERLRIEFNIDLNTLDKEAFITDLETDDLNQKVEKLRNRIHNYGEVNPIAVEAYKEMQERYENITKQRDDILAAKESLLETIKEIEITATEKYVNAFDLVRDNFRDVFRSLFTEDDDCDLILLDPSNPIESGIDIIAKPKGKRPKSLSQLSGGEKTLTAIALLFALYLLKPAPFCIFDEVDAPLDDANIQKFNRIIKKFSDDSQFIIVTHNKSTMAAVDVLYGVYMQEQGVSGVSAVDFRTYKHEDVLSKVG